MSTDDANRGPEDIKMPLAQALAVFGHDIEITSKRKAWPSAPVVAGMMGRPGEVHLGAAPPVYWPPKWGAPRRIVGMDRGVGPSLTAAMLIGERQQVLESRTTPVCTVCNDTHRMDLGERVVECTHCPVPCDRCRVKGSAYCAETPCSCECHK